MIVHSSIKAWLRFVALFSFLMLLCVGATYDYLYTNSKNTVVVESVDPQLLSVKDHCIEQELILEGTLEQLKLFCSAPSGGSYQDATITFDVQQDEKRVTTTVRAAEITSPYTLDTNLKKIGTGRATLTVEGTGFPEGTDLFLLASGTKTSGLPTSTMDDSSTPGPILMHYSVLRHDSYYFYDTIMLTLLIGVLLVIAWLMTFERETLLRGKGLFLCSFCLLFIYISLNNPSATFFAEPHSEMAYEFWYKAKYLSFFDNLMSLMSGESLVWTERLLMWLAVQLSGSGKYVFVLAQIMQTLLICGVSSMLCLPTFHRIFPAEIRLLLCWYLGGCMLFPSAYYFWAVSYWACFFLIPFAFVDMEHLPRWKYGLALIVSVILCVSRIYHILLIPIALLALISLGKTRGKRFSMYCIVVALASTFEVCYSMMAGGGGHLNMVALDVFRFLENAVYYQIQVMISILFGNAVLRALVVNVVFLLVFLSVLCSAIWLLVFCWKNIERRIYGCILTCLVMLSFGSILITVTVCGCSETVGFPIDYAARVSWDAFYYQNGDLHFSYSYFSVIAIFLTFLYVLLKKISVKSANGEFSLVRCNDYEVAAVLLAVFLITAVNPQQAYPISIIPTDWKSNYWVTTNDSYYMPINTSYQFANISLYHNSTSILCGVTENGEDAVWNPNYPAYSVSFPYSEASPGAVSDLPDRGMLSLTTHRVNTNFASPIELVLLNERGEVITCVQQTNAQDRCTVDFMLREPVYGVYSVKFQTQDGTPAYVCDGLQIGITLS